MSPPATTRRARARPPRPAPARESARAGSCRSLRSRRSLRSDDRDPVWRRLAGEVAPVDRGREREDGLLDPASDVPVLLAVRLELVDGIGSPGRSREIEAKLAARDDDRAPTDLDSVDRTFAAACNARRASKAGPSSTPCSTSISAPQSTSPCRQRWHASGPAAEPVAGSSRTPTDGANIRTFQSEPEPAKQLAITSRSVSAVRSGCREATSSRVRRPTYVNSRPLSYRSTGTIDVSTPSATSSASTWGYGSTVGTGCVIRPKTILPESSRSSSIGTTPRPVSSAMRPFCRGPASTNAVPSTGCPANGSSVRGVKILIRTSPSPSAGSTNTVSEKLISRASACIVCESSSRASVNTASWLPASGRSVKTSATTYRSVRTSPP